jgi:dTDP-4-amino-4,6-dideoxygalactose transaminase
VKLPHVPRWNELRRRHAYCYNRRLADLPQLTRPHERTRHGPVVPTSDRASDDGQVLEAVYHQYTVQVDNRDEVSKRLKEAGIGNAVYYPIPLHLQNVHAHLGYAPGSMPSAERAAGRCLSLPMFPELTERQIERVVDSLRGVLSSACQAKASADYVS